MFDFLFSSDRKRKELEKLEKELELLRKPMLRSDSKQRLKQQLLASLKSEEKAELMPLSLKKLITAIKRTSSQVRLDASTSASLKERVIDLIENHGHQLLPISYLKPALTGLLLLVFLVTTFFAFPFVPVETTYARSTYISELDGNVFVARNQEIFRATPYFRLQEGDIILTRQNSFATVNFFDDSQGRLSENTKLQIQKLQFKPFDHLASQVELFLEQGRMWGKVINLVDDDSRFIVQTNNATATVVKKASFDLSEQDNATKVSVYDNVVDLHSSQQDKAAPLKTVVAGYQAEITDHHDVIQLQPVVPTVSLTNTKDADWVASNLQRDEVYYNSILPTKEQLFQSGNINDGFQDDSSEYGKNISPFTNAQIEKTRVDFFASYADLKKGESLLASGSHNQGIQLLGQFHKVLKDFVDQFPELEKANAQEAEMLQQIIEEKVALQLKDLAPFMPGDRLYVAKEILQQAQLSLTQDQIEKAKLRLSQTDGKLFEIQHLVEVGQVSLAGTMLKNYSDQMAQFVLKISPQNYKEIEANLSDFVEKQIQQLKILTALEKSLPQTSPLKDQARSTRRDQLKKLMESLEELSASVPKDFISQLRDIFDSYLHDSADDEDLIIPLFNRLADGQHQLIFVQPSQAIVPDNIGVVTIITEENPTPDAQDAQQSQQAPSHDQTGNTQATSETLSSQTQLTEETLQTSVSQETQSNQGNQPIEGDLSNQKTQVTEENHAVSEEIPSAQDQLSKLIEKKQA